MSGLREALIQNIKRLRALKGLTQASLAERCGLSNGHIGEIETGNRFPSPEALELIAQALDVPAVHLLMLEADLRALDEARTLKEASVRLSDALVPRLSEALAALFKSAIEQGKSGHEET